MSRDKLSYYLFFCGLILLAVSLPLSRAGMSLSQALLGAGWLLAGSYTGRLRSLLNNKPALLLISVYLLHLVGLLWTSDFQYAFKDLRIKLPLLILPFMFATMPPLSKRHFRTVVVAGILGVLAGSLISTAVYLGIGFEKVADVRDISLFISHIRFALLVCVSIIGCIWLARFSATRSKWWALAYVLLAFWFFIFLFILESFTGLVIMIIYFTGYLVYLFTRLSSKLVRITGITALALFYIFGFLHVRSIIQDVSTMREPDFTTIEQYTENGNQYYHVPEAGTYENGTYVWAYICDTELEPGWNSRSEIDFNGTDAKGHKLRTTLLRYLASRGLRKDSAGLSMLSEKDIRNIESGTANYLIAETNPFNARLRQLVWEIHRYREGGDPSGHSLAQRLEYWGAALSIIRRYPVSGVGTGDVPDAFSQQYEVSGSRLEMKWRLRAHNQFLSIGVAFGIIGLVWFLFALIYPYMSLRNPGWLFNSFFAIALLSMLTEDTLETQAGVTFFAFFYCLFMFIDPDNR